MLASHLQHELQSLSRHVWRVTDRLQQLETGGDASGPHQSPNKKKLVSKNTPPRRSPRRRRRSSSPDVDDEDEDEDVTHHEKGRGHDNDNDNDISERGMKNVYDPDPDAALVVELAERIEAGEQSLSAFKEQQGAAYDVLHREEAQLTRELEDFARRVEGPEWGSGPHARLYDDIRECLPHREPMSTSTSTSAHAVRPSTAKGRRRGKGGERNEEGVRPGTAPARSTTTGERDHEDHENHSTRGMKTKKEVHPDVTAYDDYLEMYGPHGGWHPDDHQEWLRIWNVCKRDASVAIEVASEEMVGFTRDEIVAHARWHAEMSDLAYRKRAAVASWRLRQDAVRYEREVEMAAAVAYAENKAESEAQRRRREDEARRRAQQEAVLAWRAEKEAIRLENEEREAARRYTALEREREEREARQRQNKAALAAREAARARAQAQAQAQARERPTGARSMGEDDDDSSRHPSSMYRRTAEEEKAARRETQRALHVRHLKNLAQVRDRVAKADAKKASRTPPSPLPSDAKERQKLREQCQYKEVARDAQRLLAPTAVALARAEEIQEERAWSAQGRPKSARAALDAGRGVMSGNIRTVGHLKHTWATPVAARGLR